MNLEKITFNNFYYNFIATFFHFPIGFKTLASHHGLHSASAPGILALDINVNNTSKILTGGSDKTATVFNKDDEQVLKSPIRNYEYAAPTHFRPRSFCRF